MKYKHTIVQVASVAEAVLDYMLRMVESDPRVQKALGSRWILRDWSKVPMPGIEVGEGVRVVSGTQEQIQNALDRNTKMQLLIRAAKAMEIVDDDLAKEIDDLRDLRNRIHIKTLTDPEYNAYTAKMANDALSVLVQFRNVALDWTVLHRADELRQPVNLPAALAEHARQSPSATGMQAPDFPPAPFEVSVSADDDTPNLAVNDLVEHGTLGSGVVKAVDPGNVITVQFFADGSVRRLMLPYAPMVKTGVFPSAPDDDFPF
jgi:hypothetical protein